MDVAVHVGCMVFQGYTLCNVIVFYIQILTLICSTPLFHSTLKLTFPAEGIKRRKGQFIL